MKCRLVYAYPFGYNIQQSYLGLFWRYSRFINDGTIIFEDNLEEAQLSMAALKNRGKPVRIMMDLV